MIGGRWWCLLWIGTSVAFAQATAGQKFDAMAVFQEKCAICHGAPGVTRAPSPSALRAMTPEAVYAALASGSMKEMAKALTDGQRAELAEAVTEQRLGTAAIADAKAMTNPCPDGGGVRAGIEVENGYGVDLSNSRYISASAAGLSRERVGKLKLKWAFGFPGASQMIGQPTIAGGRLFAGSQAGYVYGLNAATGCVSWSFRASGGVRTAPVYRASSDGGAAIWFGDLKGNAYAVDAKTGRQIWRVNLDSHVAARITAAPVLYGDVLYVPVSSSEEGNAAEPSYECCTFRGSVAALDAKTGRKLWQTYTIPEEPRRTGRNSAGHAGWGPAGGAVWGTPVIDPKAGALYVGTGDSYTAPAPRTTDAVMALNLKTGAVLWSAQDLPNDAWVVGCMEPKATNCPEPEGPDYDFGAALILHDLPGGGRVLLAGQKSGIVWAHDPDHRGALLWKADVTREPPDATGEIVWGGAADETSVYYGLTSGGVAALDIATGKRKWLSRFNESGPHRGSPGAVTVIPGVVFAGGLDGILRALDSESGKMLWQSDTNGEVRSVNGVRAAGGSLGAPGPMVAGGMLYVESGFIGVVSGKPGNVLLAYAVPEGR
jgi:polyvinyl alcohol dehydrogenase (cytochrome)